MAKSHLKLVTPATINRTVIPKRPRNGNLRTREYLTEAEVERLMEAAKRNRWGQRDATMILVGYRHGLRVSELVDLRWDQVEFATAALYVRRVKQGTPSTHPILGDELRALRRLQREQEPKSPFVFTSEREAPFSTAGFARMVERAGREAKLASRRTRTCLGTLAVMPWPTRATTPAPCQPTSATATFSTPSGTPNYPRRGSRISGGTKGLGQKHPMVRLTMLIGGRS
jgi:integrase